MPPLPEDVHLLTPRTCMYVTLHGKRYLADALKFRILDDPSWPNAITRVLISGRWKEAEGSEKEMWQQKQVQEPEWDVKMQGCYWLWARGGEHKPKKAAASRIQKRQGSQCSPRLPRRNTTLPISWFTAQWVSLRPSHMHNCKIITTYCFKLLGSWQFVTAKVVK